MNNRLWLSMIVLALAILASASPGHTADRGAPAELLTVVMLEYRFVPNHIVLKAGQRYELHLENHGVEMHEFTAPEFLKAAIIPDKHLLSNGGTDIVVSAGQSATVVLTAPAKGQYDLICADHDWDGMTGTITVE